MSVTVRCLRASVATDEQRHRRVYHGTHTDMHIVRAYPEFRKEEYNGVSQSLATGKPREELELTAEIVIFLRQSHDFAYFYPKLKCT